MVAGLWNVRAGGSGGVRADNIKIWLRGITKEEKDDNREKYRGLMVAICPIDSDNLGQSGDTTANGVDGGHTTPERRRQLPRHRTSQTFLEGYRGLMDRQLKKRVP